MESTGGQAAAKTPRIAPFAAPMSLLLPGLGQAALGRRRRGFVLALPAMAIAVAAVAVTLSVAADPTAALDLIPDPEALPALLVLGAGLLAWHLAGIIDADRLAHRANPLRGWRRVPAALVLGVLLVAAVGVHGTIGYLEVQAGEASDSIFGPIGDDGGDAWAIPEPSF